MNVPKIFDVNTHRSLVRFLIKFVKEFNDMVKTVDVLTEKVEAQDKLLKAVNKKVNEPVKKGSEDKNAKK